MEAQARIRCAAGVIGWLLAAVAIAQTDAPAPVPAAFHGTWKVVFWQGKSNELTSKLVLAEGGGSWQPCAPGRGRRHHRHPQQPAGHLAEAWTRHPVSCNLATLKLQSTRNYSPQTRGNTLVYRLLFGLRVYEFFL